MNGKDKEEKVTVLVVPDATPTSTAPTAPPLEQPEKTETPDDKEASPANLTPANEPTAAEKPSVKADAKPSFALLRERLAHHYADEGADLNDDGIAEALALRWADEMTNRLATYFDNEGKIKDAISTYPALQKMLEDIFLNHLHPRIALANAFSAEDLTPKEGDADYADYCLLLKHKQDQTEAWTHLKTQLDDNLTTSQKTIEQFSKKHKLSEPETDRLLGLIDADWEALLQKQITAEMLEGYLKRLNYEADIELAREAGEVEGRNTRIQNLMDNQKLYVQGDRLPHPDNYAPNMLNGTKPVIDFSKFQ